jgi:hypothetical protein
LFRPFHGKGYRQFTPIEAKECVNKHKVVFVGDSRMSQLYNSVRHWIKLETSTGDYPQAVETNRFPTFGLGSLLKDPFRATMWRHIIAGRTLIINSMLHDIAQFNKNITIEAVHKYYDPQICEQCASTDTPKQCGCSKPHAIAKYMSNMQLVRSLIDDAVAERVARGLPPPKIYWLSMPKRPPTLDSYSYPWQTSDILDAMTDLAAETLSHYSHVDLAPVLQAASTDWWIDSAHLGGWPPSMLQYVSLQLLLNRICGEP